MFKDKRQSTLPRKHGNIPCERALPDVAGLRRLPTLLKQQSLAHDPRVHWREPRVVRRQVDERFHGRA